MDILAALIIVKTVWLLVSNNFEFGKESVKRKMLAADSTPAALRCLYRSGGTHFSYQFKMDRSGNFIGYVAAFDASHD